MYCCTTKASACTHTSTGTLTWVTRPPSEPRCRMSACAQNGGVCLFTHKHRTLTLMSLPSSETRCRMSTIVLLHNEGSCLYTNKSTHSHLGDTPSLRASLYLTSARAQNEGVCLYTHKHRHTHLGDTPTLPKSLAAVRVLVHKMKASACTQTRARTLT